MLAAKAVLLGQSQVALFRTDCKEIMYAIVEIAGKQFKLRKDQKIFVPRLLEEVNQNVTFDNVLLVSDDHGNVTVGSAALKDTKINVKVLEHLKGDKVIVFKKKRRNGYKVKRGHRQSYTRILVQDIIL